NRSTRPSTGQGRRGPADRGRRRLPAGAIGLTGDQQPARRTASTGDQTMHRAVPHRSANANFRRITHSRRPATPDASGTSMQSITTIPARPPAVPGDWHQPSITAAIRALVLTGPKLLIVIKLVPCARPYRLCVL